MYRFVADECPRAPRRATTTDATGSPVLMYSRTTVARIRPDRALRILVSISSRSG
jgi:hypothetical protein